MAIALALPHDSERGTGWVWSMWAAIIVFIAGIAAVVSILFLTIPHWTPGMAISLSPLLLTSISVGMLSGLILPVDDEQPFAALGSMLLAAEAQ
ncbi:MAG: hypothetical protein ACOYEV_15965 [Candidatus Nanopelagicales bacterium]